MMKQNKTSKHWRTHPDNFKAAEMCQIQRGLVELSPARFQQAHDVSYDPFQSIHNGLLLVDNQLPNGIVL